MMGSSPVVNQACWGSVSPILLNLTIPLRLQTVLVIEPQSAVDLFDGVLVY